MKQEDLGTFSPEIKKIKCDNSRFNAALIVYERQEYRMAGQHGYYHNIGLRVPIWRLVQLEQIRGQVPSITRKLIVFGVWGWVWVRRWLWGSGAKSRRGLCAWPPIDRRKEHFDELNSRCPVLWSPWPPAETALHISTSGPAWERDRASRCERENIGTTPGPDISHLLKPLKQSIKRE